MKELWLFTCLNTKSINWGLNCQCDRSKFCCLRAESELPGLRAQGVPGQAPWQGYSAETCRHLRGFMSRTGCLHCSFWQVTEIPPLLRQRSHLVWACAGAWWGSTASAGLPLVLSKTSDSLNLCLKNLDCAGFTFREISLMSFRHEKGGVKSVSFSFLLNPLKNSEIPYIVWRGAGLL